jgi:NAD(P)-dependent dehydrogenase (short-subunit alcohol dehydrogenase family)
VETVNVVLVTNAGQGFGRTVALAFGALGYDVVCADRDVDLASKTAAEVEEAGGQAIPIQATMSVHMDVLNAFGKVFEIFGNLGGLVHVAAHESLTDFDRLGEGEFADLLDEGLRSSFLSLRTASRMLDKAWVLLIGPPTRSNEPHMVALRSAIAGLAQGMSSDGLTVNALFPSRPAADPRHDEQLAAFATFLAAGPDPGLSGQTFDLALPPPPKIVESLLPEVQAALDDRVRQDDLEASLLDGEDDLDDDDTDLDSDERFDFDSVHDHHGEIDGYPVAELIDPATDDAENEREPDSRGLPVGLVRPLD